jgi:hypothetical protein
MYVFVLDTFLQSLKLLVKEFVNEIIVFYISQQKGKNNILRVCLAGLRLWLWLCWWSGFGGGAESVFKKHLTEQLLLAV